jgi:peptidoglycan/LPS O-acetylase OafA/YrhL
VQAQFYVAFPVLLLLLRPRTDGLFRRLAIASAAIIGAVTAYRASVALRFELPVPVFGPLDDARMLALMTETLRVSYYSLLPRLTHLFFGVLGACAMRSLRVREGLVSGSGAPN